MAYLVALVVFSLVWLLPITWVGMTGRSIPEAGRYANYAWRIACLFPRRAPYWDDYFYEVKTGVDGGWTEVPHHILGDMRPFGAGNRLHRIMAQGGGDSNRAAVLRSVADFIRRRYESENPELSAVTEVRFVRWRHPVGSPETAANPEPWRIPTLDEVPEQARVVWRHFLFEKRRRPGAEAAPDAR